ncbi:MAG: PilZ domain-containing protein [Phycisphaerae bacterium]|nr:PilZ domain-containing protein [Phycisphaerae bacterium]
MTKPVSLVGRERDQLLADAVHEKARLVLTARGKESWETHKSRLLDMAPARRALVVAFPYDVEGPEIDFTRGEQIGVAFRHHSRKCLFASTVIGKRQPRQNPTRHTGSKALLLSWPEQIEQLQRRVYYRVEVPEDCPIVVQFWRGGVLPHMAIPPIDRPIVVGRVQDLSVGGMRVEIAQSDNPRLETDEMVGAEFAAEPGKQSIVLEACFRHIEPSGPKKLSLGFQFIGLEVAAEGPSLLSRLAHAVSRLQRVNGPDPY